MILGRENNTNNNERVEIELNGNLINFEPEMANQALKLPLKEVAKLVPEFDGNNITLGEYIEKLKQAKEIISVTDEQNLVQVLKIKLKGEVYKALANVEMPNIETFIQTLCKLYHSTDNTYSLYGKLTQQIQKADQDVKRCKIIFCKQFTNIRHTNSGIKKIRTKCKSRDINKI